MKITAILASLAIVATGAAAQVEEAAFNLGHYIKHNVIGISEEEAFKLGHYIAHNVVGISEEEQNMSLAEMAKRYNKIKKFIPVAEQEDLKLPKIGVTIGEEEAMSLIEMGKRYNKIKKFIPLSEQEEEEEAMSLKTMLDRYNKVKKFIPLSEEEEAFKLGHYITHNVIGINEEEDMSLTEMAKRYNKVKKFIPLSEAEEAMSLKTMLDRYNKVKKFIPLSEEEENMSLLEMAKRYNKVKKFIPVAEEEALKINPNFVACKGTVEQCRKHGIFSEEEAINLEDFLKSKVIGRFEEEEDMSLKTMFNRYNKVRKFIPAEEENLKTTSNRLIRCVGKCLPDFLKNNTKAL